MNILEKILILFINGGISLINIAIFSIILITILLLIQFIVFQTTKISIAKILYNLIFGEVQKCK